MAFTTLFDEGTNNKAEIEAATFRSDWALELGFKKIMQEVDSLLLVVWILEKNNLPMEHHNSARKAT